MFEIKLIMQGRVCFLKMATDCNISYSNGWYSIFYRELGEECGTSTKVNSNIFDTIDDGVYVNHKKVELTDFVEFSKDIGVSND